MRSPSVSSEAEVFPLLPVECGDTPAHSLPALFVSQAHTRPDDGRARGVFDVGDKVVYPHHGAGTVVSKDVKIVLGEEREYLTIKILHNDMTVNVPTDNAEKVGLRWVIHHEMVEVVNKVLLGGSTEMPKNWNR